MVTPETLEHTHTHLLPHAKLARAPEPLAPYAPHLPRKLRARVASSFALEREARLARNGAIERAPKCREVGTVCPAHKSPKRGRGGPGADQRRWWSRRSPPRVLSPFARRHARPDYADRAALGRDAGRSLMHGVHGSVFNERRRGCAAHINTALATTDAHRGKP